LSIRPFIIIFIYLFIMLPPPFRMYGTADGAAWYIGVSYHIGRCRRTSYVQASVLWRVLQQW